MKQNITLSIDKELIRKAKVLAAQQQTSISGLLSDELKAIVEAAERYELARQEALQNLKEGFRLDGHRSVHREELHER